MIQTTVMESHVPMNVCVKLCFFLRKLQHSNERTWQQWRHLLTEHGTSWKVFLKYLQCLQSDKATEHVEIRGFQLSLLRTWEFTGQFLKTFRCTAETGAAGGALALHLWGDDIALTVNTSHRVIGNDSCSCKIQDSEACLMWSPWISCLKHLGGWCYRLRWNCEVNTSPNTHHWNTEDWSGILNSADPLLNSSGLVLWEYMWWFVVLYESPVHIILHHYMIIT